MKKLFLDTNILIDFLADRKPFSIAAAQLFEAALQGRCTLYVSAISYNNIYYIMRQSATHAVVLKLLQSLAELTTVVDVNKQVIGKGLSSDFKDFEDAIQYYSALTIPKLDVIVTRDAKHFKSSSVAVMAPQEAASTVWN